METAVQVLVNLKVDGFVMDNHLLVGKIPLILIPFVETVKLKREKNVTIQIQRMTMDVRPHVEKKLKGQTVE